MRAGGAPPRATPTPSRTPKTHPTEGATAATPNTRRRPSRARPKPMKRHGRRPRFKSPFSEARDRALRKVTLPFRRLPPTPRFLVGFLALAVLTTLLLARTHSALTSAEVYQEGDPARIELAVQSFRTSWMILRQQAEVRGSANTNGSNAANINAQRELLWPGQ